MRLRKIIEVVRADLHPNERHRKFETIELKHFECLDEDELEYVDYVVFTDVASNNVKLLKSRDGVIGTLKVE